MNSAIFWFRNDLRLHDNPALTAVSERVDRLTPAYCHGHLDETTRWGFQRVGAHRGAFVRAALDGLATDLGELGSGLVETCGDPVEAVYSNQGNWLYLAGRGTDPRGGRQFDPHKQARQYDSHGACQSLWSHQ